MYFYFQICWYQWDQNKNVACFSQPDLKIKLSLIVLDSVMLFGCISWDCWRCIIVWSDPELGRKICWNSLFFFIVANPIYKMKTMGIEHNTSLDFFYYSLTLFWDNSYSVSMSLQESVRILAYYDNYNTNPRKILFFGNYLKYCFFFEKKGTIHMSKILWKRNQVKSGLNTDRSWAFQLTLSLPDFPNISRHWSPSERLWKGPSMSKNDSKRKENVVKGSRGLLTAQNSFKVLRIESIVPRFS